MAVRPPRRLSRSSLRRSLVLLYTEHCALSGHCPLQCVHNHSPLHAVPQSHPNLKHRRTRRKGGQQLNARLEPQRKRGAREQVTYSEKHLSQITFLQRPERTLWHEMIRTLLPVLEQMWQNLDGATGALTARTPRHAAALDAAPDAGEQCPSATWLSNSKADAKRTAPAQHGPPTRSMTTVFSRETHTHGGREARHQQTSTEVAVSLYLYPL